MKNYELISKFQTRCVNCNSKNKLEIHHRVFRSEGNAGILKLISEVSADYKECYGKELGVWTMNDIQNLVVLCYDCHQNRIHNGDNNLRMKFRNSFTCPVTFFNIPFKKQKSLW